MKYIKMDVFIQFMSRARVQKAIEYAIQREKTALNLSSMEIENLPRQIEECTFLDELYLHKNNISSLNCILNLTNLTLLTLDRNNIMEIPREIQNLLHLEELNLSNNRFNILTPEICKLRNLQVLWCNNVGLREIPKDICNLENLDTFGARGNMLEEIPIELMKLKNLRWLTLDKNLIRGIPESINQLECIVHLNMSHNLLSTLPVSIQDCRDLSYIFLVNNNITELPQDFDSNKMVALQLLDLRDNPIATNPNLQELSKYQHLRFQDSQEIIQQVRSQQDAESPEDNEQFFDANSESVEASSSEESLDWEHSVVTSDLDSEPNSDAEDNEMNFQELLNNVLPELSKFTSNM